MPSPTPPCQPRTAEVEPGSSGHAVAIHGLRCPLPASWDVVGTYGSWRKGHLLVAEDRQPRLALSWVRGAAAPDLERSLLAAGRRLARHHIGGVLVGREALGDHGLLGHWDGEQGAFHAAVRHLPAAGATLIARQLAPGAAAPLRAVVAGAEAGAVDQPAPWQLYGVAVRLPAWWRLEGVQQLAGLTRAVWFRHPGGAAAPDQVLVVRRLACAARVLAGRTLAAWVRDGLAGNERAVAEDERDGVAHVRAERPAASWLRRLRGRVDRREFHAWIEAGSDRLLLQEWKGADQPLPCLRDTQSPPR
jgi:hypothetical protein